MAHIILEQVFDAPLSDDEHARIATQVDECLNVRGARWMRSYLSIDRKRMMCEFEAPDAQSLRDAYRSAGVGFERAWAALLYKRE